jgi:hypothetical protein
MYSRKLLSKSFQEAENIRIVPLKRSSMTGSVEILSDIELCQSQNEKIKPRRKKLTRKVSSTSRFYECVGKFPACDFQPADAPFSVANSTDSNIFF